MSIEVYFILLALGLPMYFLWRWVFRNSKMSIGSKRTAIWTSTIISTPLIYVSIITIWVLSNSYYPKRDFDKKAWFADKEMRYEMSIDIIDSKMLIGKTKKEVTILLGASDENEPDVWHYYLGYVPGFAGGLDPDFLDITFKNGKVVSVSQHSS